MAGSRLGGTRTVLTAYAPGISWIFLKIFHVRPLFIVNRNKKPIPFCAWPLFARRCCRLIDINVTCVRHGILLDPKVRFRNTKQNQSASGRDRRVRFVYFPLLSSRPSVRPAVRVYSFVYRVVRLWMSLIKNGLLRNARLGSISVWCTPVWPWRMPRLFSNPRRLFGQPTFDGV